MQNKNILQPARSLLLFIFSWLLISTCQAQEKRVELKEMKDTISLMISTVKDLEKQANPDKEQLSDLRKKLMLLVIYNGNKECGTWPPPDTKIEIIEAYWKCTFDKAIYGKTFVLNPN